MLFIEMYLLNDEGRVPDPDEDCNGICVKASRLPKDLAEAKEWAGKVKPDTTGVFLYEPISAENAEWDYNMRADDEKPVFPLNGR